MIPLFNLLPGGNPLMWAAGAALAASLTFGGVQSFRLAGTRTDLAEAKRDHAVAIATLQQAAREQAEQIRATEHQWQEVQHENARLASKARDRALVDAAAADAAADRLRDRFAAVAAACRPGADDPAAVAAGPAASAPADLLADVFGRMDEATRRIAAYADAASIAGEQCAADYTALMPRP